MTRLQYRLIFLSQLLNHGISQTEAQQALPHRQAQQKAHTSVRPPLLEMQHPQMQLKALTQVTLPPLAHQLQSSQQSHGDGMIPVALAWQTNQSPTVKLPEWLILPRQAQPYHSQVPNPFHSIQFLQ